MERRNKRFSIASWLILAAILIILASIPVMRTGPRAEM